MLAEKVEGAANSNGFATVHHIKKEVTGDRNCFGSLVKDTDRNHPPC